ncbi:3-phosphoshikimate 1-carboxyvinyltransferase, chloroplastic [Lathyrus oleraceus]|uniref:3-phosphoshikimate 1-carboxyvinyltransferase, chloroplastic n=1 Tax=Pisum sativum TaxID=3888 RepID=UPI0021D08C2F|nr:3-phosphoshikimate 1-carboxyvinyltransferase, chloroplastic-like [Pisum sativum]
MERCNRLVLDLLPLELEVGTIKKVIEIETKLMLATVLASNNFEKVSDSESAKETWEIPEKSFGGTEKVKDVRDEKTTKQAVVEGSGGLFPTCRESKGEVNLFLGNAGAAMRPLTAALVAAAPLALSDVEIEIIDKLISAPMGAKVTWTENSVIVTGPPRDSSGRKVLQGIDINMNKMPDVAMTLAVVALSPSLV